MESQSQPCLQTGLQFLDPAKYLDPGVMCRSFPWQHLQSTGRFSCSEGFRWPMMSWKVFRTWLHGPTCPHLTLDALFLNYIGTSLPQCILGVTFSSGRLLTPGSNRISLICNYHISSTHIKSNPFTFGFFFWMTLLQSDHVKPFDLFLSTFLQSKLSNSLHQPSHRWWRDAPVEHQHWAPVLSCTT